MLVQTFCNLTDDGKVRLKIPAELTASLPWSNRERLFLSERNSLISLVPRRKPCRLPRCFRIGRGFILRARGRATRRKPCVPCVMPSRDILIFPLRTLAGRRSSRFLMPWPGKEARRGSANGGLWQGGFWLGHQARGPCGQSFCKPAPGGNGTARARAC
jgi:hypothetical protein